MVASHSKTLPDTSFLTPIATWRDDLRQAKMGEFFPRAEEAKAPAIQASESDFQSSAQGIRALALRCSDLPEAGAFDCVCLVLAGF